MIRICLTFLLLVIVFTRCGISNSREEALQQKESEVALREQQVLLRERAIAQKEVELLQREQQLDSAATDSTTADSAAVANQQLLGQWNVRMVCTETSCPGSAIGDTRTETWSFAIDDNKLVARATDNAQLVRVYIGQQVNERIELVADVPPSSTIPATKMVVRLSVTDSTKMEGQREIIRENDCKILYALQLSKL